MNAAAPNTESPRPIARMSCHATDPNPVTRQEKPGARCGRLLGYAQSAIRFVGIAARAPDAPDGRIWVRCARSDCHAWNIFEAIGEGSEGEG